MAATDAKPVPRKNQAFRLYLPGVKKDGSLITGGTGMDTEISKDGVTFTDAANEATEIGASGCYYIDFTATEMNADCVIVKVTWTNTDALPYVYPLYPEETGDIRVQATGMDDGLIAAAKFGAGAITSTVLAANAIGASQIASNAITAAKIADDSLTESKFSSGFWSTLWNRATSTLTTVGGIGKLLVDTLDTAISTRLAGAGYTTPPTAAAIRAEIDANSTKLDAAVSTRLAGASYTAPPTVAAIRAEIDSNSTKLDATISSRLAAAGYTAPLNAAGIRAAVGLAAANLDGQLLAIDDVIDTEVGAILAKVNALPSDPADQSAVEAAITAAVASLATSAAQATAAAILAKLDALIELNGSDYRFTDTALELAPTGTGGGEGGATPAEIWAYSNRTLTSGANIALAKGTGVTGFNDLSAAQVNAEVDAALVDYDPATGAEVAEVPGGVWSHPSRLLTGFGTLVDDIKTAVWSATTRTLTAFGFNVTVQTNNDKSGYGLAANAVNAAALATDAVTELQTGLAKTTDLSALATTAQLAPLAKTTELTPLATATQIDALAGLVEAESGAVVARIDALETHGDSEWTGGGEGGGLTADEVWTHGNRSLTDKAGFGLADNAITAAKIATNAIDADALAQSALDEIAGAVGAGSGDNPLAGSVPGNYSPGTAGYALGMIANSPYAVHQPVKPNGAIKITQSETYKAELGNAINIDVLGFPSVDGKTALLTVWDKTTQAVIGGGSIQGVGISATRLQFELSSEDSAAYALPYGALSKEYLFEVVVEFGADRLIPAPLKSSVFIVEKGGIAATEGDGG